jgi:hypothetical protein
MNMTFFVTYKDTKESKNFLGFQVETNFFLLVGQKRKKKFQFSEICKKKQQIENQSEKKVDVKKIDFFHAFQKPFFPKEDFRTSEYKREFWQFEENTVFVLHSIFEKIQNISFFPFPSGLLCLQEKGETLPVCLLKDRHSVSQTMKYA